MLTEQELVDNVLNGNAKAFERLVTQYEKLVLHVISRMIRSDDDLQDVCQEVFIKIYRGLHSFRFQSKLSTWIARLAYLTALNYLRTYKNEAQGSYEREAPGLNTYHFSEETPEQLLIRKDVSAYVHELILQLPLHYRTVLTLFYLDEFSIPEIQAITGMPEGTVKSYLFRAKQLLKTKLEVYLSNE